MAGRETKYPGEDQPPEVKSATGSGKGMALAPSGGRDSPPDPRQDVPVFQFCLANLLKTEEKEPKKNGFQDDFQQDGNKNG
jgi:hypothetical protein